MHLSIKMSFVSFIDLYSCRLSSGYQCDKNDAKFIRTAKRSGEKLSDYADLLTAEVQFLRWKQEQHNMHVYNTFLSIRRLFLYSFIRPKVCDDT